MNSKHILLWSLLAAVLLTGGNALAQRSTPAAPSPAAETQDHHTSVQLEAFVEIGLARTAPSLDATVKFRLVRGDIVSLVERQADWYRIRNQAGAEGWAHRSLFADPAAGGESPTPSAEVASAPQASPAAASDEPVKMTISPVDRDLLSINLFDVDIRKALAVLAMDRAVNIAAGKNVSGKISVHLHRVTLAQALQAIALAGGFRYHRQGNLYYVYKPKDELDPQSARLEMRIFQLKYGDIEKVQEVLDDLPNLSLIHI